MKFVQPSYIIIDQEPGIDGIYKQIELAGRTCYKSEDKMTDVSSRAFVQRMINSGHNAMLEHGTVYLSIPKNSKYADMFLECRNNPYVKCSWVVSEDTVYVTTNYRYIIESNSEECMKIFLSPNPNRHHRKRVTVLFHTQIAISREFNRHRANSMAESSTRYCNYSKDKFGNEITVNLPSWIEQDSITSDKTNEASIQTKLAALATYWNNKELKFIKSFDAIDYWILANSVAEYCYMGLIKCGWAAQQARTILPLDTNTDLVHTAFVSDWKHFFDLRALGTTGKSHPDAKCVAYPLYNDFKMRGLL